MTKVLGKKNIIEMIEDARNRTLELLQGLDNKQLIGPQLPNVNPLLWEIGHVAFFYDYFILKEKFNLRSVLGDDAEKLYDSITIAHKNRWKLPLPSLEDTLSYMENVQDRIIQKLDDIELDEEINFAYQFGIYHEDMHAEAFLWGRQALGYPFPALSNNQLENRKPVTGAYPGFAEIPGGTFRLGASPSDSFYFDNEKWEQNVKVEPFSIALAPVTNQEFAQFVDEGGYSYSEFWCPDGLKWLNSVSRRHPGYWENCDSESWLVRRFDKYFPISPYEPVIHVNWFEARAYCAWAGFRLPTELEWEVAAVGIFDEYQSLSNSKHLFPWGDVSPNTTLANLDGVLLGCTDVADFPEGDSLFGCRQMLGNVWEWTSDTFSPFPGFEADSYDEYSAPLFGTTRVLKGGAWTSRGRMIRPGYRNFFAPERWDIFSGFRGCKLR